MERLPRTRRSENPSQPLRGIFNVVLTNARILLHDPLDAKEHDEQQRESDDEALRLGRVPRTDDSAVLCDDESETLLIFSMGEVKYLEREQQGDDGSKEETGANPVHANEALADGELLLLLGRVEEQERNHKCDAADGYVLQ